MNTEVAKKLREPFPVAAIGKLPKGNVMLDYVGHAAVTDRLLQVDPEWVWEPFALTDDGLPALDKAGNLWIKLTICGVTRPGVGDGKNAKECISDAIRNAAMRFGVALDLWAKEDLHADEAPAQPKPKKPAAAPAGVTEALELKAKLDALKTLAATWKTLHPEFDPATLDSWLEKETRSAGDLDTAITAYKKKISDKTAEADSDFQVPTGARSAA